MTHKAKAIGLYAAISLVIANMIGTGVFGSLGFQLPGIHSIFSILMLWTVGGVLALCGALSYGEIGAALPRSGGEYNYLSQIYHPVLGFLAGFVSAVVGFAAPIASSAILFGEYFSRAFPGSVEPKVAAMSLVALLTTLHSISLKGGIKFQSVFTTIKVLFCIFFIIAGLGISNPQSISIMPQSDSWAEMLGVPFSISLVYVSYAYSGWNASAYIAGEMENPQKNLPRSLLVGTLVVMVIYVLLNFVFLYVAPISEMIGQKDVAYPPAMHIFGEIGGKIMSGAIAFLLISTVSSMIIAGPRVISMMGEDNPAIGFLAKRTNKGTPATAIVLQSAITVALILTVQFDWILRYIGFTLSIFTLLTVVGLFVLRIKKPDLPRPYKTWGYPIVPIIFIVISSWILFNIVKMDRSVTNAALITFAVGILFYLNDKYKIVSGIFNNKKS